PDMARGRSGGSRADGAAADFAVHHAAGADCRGGAASGERGYVLAGRGDPAVARRVLVGRYADPAGGPDPVLFQADDARADAGYGPCLAAAARGAGALLGGLARPDLGGGAGRAGGRVAGAA